MRVYVCASVCVCVFVCAPCLLTNRNRNSGKIGFSALDSWAEQMQIFHLNNLPVQLVMCLFHDACTPGSHASKNAILHIISAQGASTMLWEVCIFRKTIITLLSGYKVQAVAPSKALRMRFPLKGFCVDGSFWGCLVNSRERDVPSEGSDFRFLIAARPLCSACKV